jgi:hypothetical protein
MINVINEAIERAHRIRGTPRDEIVRRAPIGVANPIRHPGFSRQPKAI